MKIIRNSSISTKFSNDKLLKRYLRLLLWINSIEDHSLYLKMLDRIIFLKNNNGNAFAIKYLKTCKLALDHYLSGNPIDHLGHTPRIAIKLGIPLIIPKGLHPRIVNRELGVIRVIQGLLSIFRILPCKGELKLTTITKEFSGLTTRLNPIKVEDLWNRLFYPIRGSNPIGRSFLLNLKTAGPNHKVSILGAPSDAYFIYNRRADLRESLKVISQYFGSDLNHLLQDEIDYLKDIVPKTTSSFLEGKLSTKLEAAGKVRVFAIIDVWAQTCLEPIHKHVFNILRNIENDGCFDQDKPVRRLLSKGLLNTFSYDLSAATDRFPIDFQVQVLSLLYTKEIAEHWKNLLVNRTYTLKASKAFGDKQELRYSVGQPMGALSSWGVFSLCHHFVVQYAAAEKGFRTWFDDYALLGDDIVIGNKEVANHYHYIMTELLGVEINLSKSLQSEIGVVEFAKRLLSPTEEFSPIGPKNIALALKAPAHLSTVVLDFVNKGGLIQQPKIHLSKLSHEIVKISRNKLESLLWSIQGPFGFLDSGHWFGPVKAETMLPLLKDSYWRNFISSVGFIDECFNSVIVEDLKERKQRAIERGVDVINKYKNLLEIPNFESDTIQDLPSFRGFKLTAYEEILKCYDEIPEVLPFVSAREAKTVSAVIKRKFEMAPQIPILDNCLIANKVQRPRFRFPSIDFFTKLSAKIAIKLAGLGQVEHNIWTRRTWIDSGSW